MATLQKIRNNAGLLVSIVIGLALLAFILGDLFQSGSSLFSKSQTEVGEIAGKSVGIQMYQGKIDENLETYKRNTGQSSIDQATTDQLQEQTWEQLIREFVMVETYEKLGIGVSGNELFDMVQGNNIDPQIMQIPIFQNQETGQFDRNLVIQFLKNMELDPSGNQLASWHAFENALVQQKIDQKYNTLIEKAMIATKAQAKFEYTAKNAKVDFDYIGIKYNTVSDSLITVNKSDLEAYYEDNKDKFKQEETRELNYVTFPVVASAEDEKETEEWIAKLNDEFKSVENAEQFVSLNSDVPFNSNYLAESALSPEIQSLYNAEAGTVVGPYRANNAFNISKLIDSKNLPDSVKARHILIRSENGVNAKAIADSLLQVINKGGNFAELAKQYSQDGSAAEGGDLGWFTAGAMVKPFNDACFFGKTGDVVAVTTQFGEHVIEIVNQGAKSKQVQIATISRLIEPSTKTYQATFAAASKFGGNNRTYETFRAEAEKAGYSIRTASVKRDDKTLANFDNPRQIIRWTYQGEKGAVSEIFELDDVFIIAAIKSVQEKGIATFEQATFDVEREVKRIKKAAYITKQLNDAKNGAVALQTVADKLYTSISESVGTSFAAYSITGLGFEPEVQAGAFEYGVEKISDPIEGKTGVYLIQVKYVQQPAAATDFTNDKNYLERSYRSRVGYQVYEAIKEASEIKDNRANFY